MKVKNFDSAYILDNGACTIKVERSESKKPRIIPNCVMKAKSERRRLFIGDQVDDCRDASGLYYILPFQKGLLMNFELQKNIWDYVFGKDCCPATFSEEPLIITDPYHNFVNIQEGMIEIFFEEYDCQSLLKINAGDLAAYHYAQDYPDAKCCFVIDSGFSFTHMAPYIKGKKVRNWVKRLDVGGKLLTNHLKDIISYRQLHVMEETFVMNQVKEDTCYVAQDLMAEMRKARKKYPENDIVRDYILPDFTNLRRGYVRTLDQPTVTEQQKLRLNNERFSVPEILFHPSDIGIEQMGIPEAVAHCIKNCPEEAQSHLYNNIVVVGGSSLFPGFKERLYKEIRASAPEDFDVRITVPENPITYSWEGGALLTKDPAFTSMLVTKEEYDDIGISGCIEKFNA